LPISVNLLIALFFAQMPYNSLLPHVSAWRQESAVDVLGVVNPEWSLYTQVRHTYLRSRCS